MTPDVSSVLERADRLFTGEQVEQAIRAMAERISARIGHAEPVVITVMTGGLFTTAMLLRHLRFPLQQDYIHLTRYRDETVGGKLEWIRKPAIDLGGRTVLLVDDLLDQGVTLNAAIDHCRAAGASNVLTAVLVVKDIVARQGAAAVDFHGLDTPDRYLFGSGMDYKSYWRNACGIYAVE